ncbi:MAG: Fe-S oxidoreductase [Chthoniobacter sp.]|jgi:L-lactate dehydrogenase complex protein LldE|nr:Fe-S oxidoreductase [Chthoniobacter sp.]
MRVTLFVPCFIDSLYPGVAMAMVKVIERLGHEVDYPEGQTCCGQPPFNSGYWDEARAVAERQLAVFRDAEVVVSGSGSCGAMFKVFYPELFAKTAQESAAQALSAKTYEFSEFLVSKLGVRDVGATFEGKVTFHDGCHGLRELGTKAAPRELLRHVKGLELIEMGEAEACCGFGGMFAVKFPQISTAMAEVKCNSIVETGVEYVVSNDSSCLMQIQGYLSRHSPRVVKSLHLAEVLART